MEQKWLDRFNRLEALLLAKTLDQPQQEPTLSTVKVLPAHSPPANVIRSDSFIKPTDQSVSQPTDRPSVSTDRPSVSATTDPPASKLQSDRPQAMDQPTASDRPSTSVSSAFQLTRRDIASDSDSHSVVSDQPLFFFVFFLRRVNCRMNWMPLSPTLTSLSLRRNPTGKP